MATKQQPMPMTVSIEQDGTRYKGIYTIIGDVVTVRALGGRIATPVGHSSVAGVAELLLLELVEEHRRQTASLKTLITRRRRESNDAGADAPSTSPGTMHLSNLSEVATRLDHIQALADELAKCHRDPLVQIDLAPRLQHEILAAKLALNRPR